MDEAEIGGEKVKQKDKENDSRIDEIAISNKNEVVIDSKGNTKKNKIIKAQKKDINGKKSGRLIEEESDIPLKVFSQRVVRIFFYLVIWVFPSYLGGRLILHLWDKWYNTEAAQGWSWKPFLIIQFITTRLTYYVSKLFSIPVELEKVTGLHYPEPLDTYHESLGTLIIIPDCTGILEMIFITALLMGSIMGFRLRMNIRKRLKWIGILCGILYIENIIRLVLNWPIAKAYGYKTWSEIHIWWWKTGQLIFVLLLFFGWFVLVGKKYLPVSENSQESNPRLKSLNTKSKTAKKASSSK